MHAGDRADAAVGAVEVDERADVDVAQAVAVGEDEGVGVDVVADAVEPAPGARVQPGLGQRDLGYKKYRI